MSVQQPPISFLIPENAPFSAEQRAWLSGFLAAPLTAEAAAGPAVDAAPAAPAIIDSASLGRCREQPTIAKLLGRRLLNRPGSEKETWHIDFDLSKSGIDYEVGDSFGIFAKNDLGLVDQLIAMLGAAHTTPVRARTLREVLHEDLSLGL